MARILIIDDEEPIRFSLRGILEDEGYEVLEAATAEEGLEVADAERPDLVFLDIWLPGGTAYITDLGMTGPELSVLGVRPEASISWLKTGLPTRFEISDGACMMCGAIIDVDEKTGKSRSIERICVR